MLLSIFILLSSTVSYGVPAMSLLLMVCFSSTCYGLIFDGLFSFPQQQMRDVMRDKNTTLHINATIICYICGSNGEEQIAGKNTVLTFQSVVLQCQHMCLSKKILCRCFSVCVSPKHARIISAPFAGLMEKKKLRRFSFFISFYHINILYGAFICKWTCACAYLWTYYIGMHLNNVVKQNRWN